MRCWKEWAKAAGIRALKTVAQTAVGMLSGEMIGIVNVDWLAVLSVSAMAGVVSLLTSLAGLPECDDKKEDGFFSPVECGLDPAASVSWQVFFFQRSAVLAFRCRIRYNMATSSFAAGGSVCATADRYTG